MFQHNLNGNEIMAIEEKIKKIEELFRECKTLGIQIIIQERTPDHNEMMQNFLNDIDTNVVRISKKDNLDSIIYRLEQTIKDNLLRVSDAMFEKIKNTWEKVKSDDDIVEAKLRGFIQEWCQIMLQNIRGKDDPDKLIRSWDELRTKYEKKYGLIV